MMGYRILEVVFKRLNCMCYGGSEPSHSSFVVISLFVSMLYALPVQMRTKHETGGLSFESSPLVTLRIPSFDRAMCNTTLRPNLPLRTPMLDTIQAKPTERRHGSLCSRKDSRINLDTTLVTRPKESVCAPGVVLVQCAA